MSAVLVQSLEITGLGMGLVFAAIIVLWLMMVVLAAFTSDKDPSTTVSTSRASESTLESAPISLAPALSPAGSGVVRAAAVAVALALAEQQASSARALPTPPTAIVSAWQLGMRTRLLAEKGNFRRPAKE